VEAGVDPAKSGSAKTTDKGQWWIKARRPPKFDVGWRTIVVAAIPPIVVVPAVAAVDIAIPPIVAVATPIVTPVVTITASSSIAVIIATTATTFAASFAATLATARAAAVLCNLSTDHLAPDLAIDEGPDGVLCIAEVHEGDKRKAGRIARHPHIRQIAVRIADVDQLILLHLRVEVPDVHPRPLGSSRHFVAALLRVSPDVDVSRAGKHAD
jgi:hypothetical protein